MKFSFSDLISRIRSAYEMLVLTSLALILTIILAKSPTSITTAEAELKIVQNVVSRESWDPQFIENAFILQPGIAGDRTAFYKYWNLELDTETINRGGEVTSPVDTLGITAPIDTFVGWKYVYNLANGTVPEIPAPQNISEFAELWNKARHVEWLATDELLDPPYAYVQLFPGSPIKKVTLKVKDSKYLELGDGASALPAVFSPNIFRAEEVDPAHADLYGLTTTGELGHGDDTYFRIWIPGRAMVTSDMYSFDATDYLCTKMRLEKQRCFGPFEQVFSELYLATKDFQDIRFDFAMELLEKEKIDSLQNFELFGLKINIGILNSIGSLAVISLQIYLWSHLDVLGKTDFQAEVPAWVGLFPHKLARIFALISSTLLPLATVFILTFWLKGIPSMWEKLLSLALFVSAVSSSILLTVAYVFIWKQIGDLTPGIVELPKPSTRKKKQNS